MFNPDTHVTNIKNENVVKGTRKGPTDLIAEDVHFLQRDVKELSTKVGRIEGVVEQISKNVQQLLRNALETK